MTDVPPPAPQSPRRSVWRRLQRLPLTMMTASLLIVLGIVQLTFQLGQIVYRTSIWNSEKVSAAARIHTLQQDVNILRDAVNAASTPDHLRELVRCRGFVGGQERVVVSQSAPDAPVENCRALRVP